MPHVTILATLSNTNCAILSDKRLKSNQKRRRAKVKRKLGCEGRAKSAGPKRDLKIKSGFREKKTN